MADCNILLNDGSNILLNDGVSVLLLNSCDTGAEGGGGAGTRTRSTQKGVSIYDRDPSIPGKKRIEPEWQFEVTASLAAPQLRSFEASARLKMKNTSKRIHMAFEKFAIRQEGVMDWAARFRSQTYSEWFATSKFYIKEKPIQSISANISYTKLINTLESYIRLLDEKQFTPKKPHVKVKRKKENTNSFSFEEDPADWITAFESIDIDKLRKLWNELTPKQRKALLKEININDQITTRKFDDLPDNVKETLIDAKEDDLEKILKIILGTTALSIALTILRMPSDTPISQIRENPINPKTLPGPVGKDPPNISITAPSSFIGIVTYSPAFQTMDMKLNSRTYSWCQVPQRIFDGFKGASSKGAFFNRNIKGQYDC